MNIMFIAAGILIGLVCIFWILLCHFVKKSDKKYEDALYEYKDIKNKYDRLCEDYSDINQENTTLKNHDTEYSRREIL